MIRVFTLLCVIMIADAGTPAEAGIVKRLLSERAKNNAVSGEGIAGDIAYGADAEQRLDIYSPLDLRENEKRPVLIGIHGGGWEIGDKKMYRDIGEMFRGQGIVYVSINYRLSPDHKHPAQAEDSAAAVKWVYDHIGEYGGDAENIFISGHSAGAHLAALIASDPKYLSAHGLKTDMFRAVFPNDTASFDFTMPIVKGRRMVQPMIDRNFGTHPQGLKDASPNFHAQGNKALPRFVIFVTDTRPDAALQSKMFSATIAQSGGKSEVHVINGYSHSDMAQAMEDENSQIGRIMLEVIEDEGR